MEVAQPKSKQQQFLEAEKCRYRRQLSERIRYARESAGLTQERLAKKMGLSAHQTISQIENGEREVQPDDLLSLCKVLKRDLDFFTDPTLLIGEGKFSWRASASSRQLDKYEQVAARYIGIWREASRLINASPKAFTKTVPLTSESRYVDAWNTAEAVVQEWELGAYPSKTLAEKVEQHLDILVLHVDAPNGVSGAACWLPEFGAILINRNESEARQNFDLAHELFHLLTWAAMPPDRIDKPPRKGIKRTTVELLADNFAAALLMPIRSVQASVQSRDNAPLRDWLLNTAPLFRVSCAALFYRASNLGLLGREKFPPEKLSWQTTDMPTKGLFSKKFLETLAKAIERGWMSPGRLTSVLKINSDQLNEVLLSHGLAEISR